MRYLLGFLLALFACAPTSASIYIPPFDMGPTITRQIFDPIIADQKRRGARAEDADEERAAQPDVASLSFKPSPTRRRANLAQFAKKARASDPAGAAAMEQLFATTDVIGAIDGQMRTVGLRADNVADSYALWWIMAWYAANGSDSTPDRETARAVRDQAASALLATPEFADAGEATKQELAEALMIQAALIAEMNTQAQGKPAEAARLAAAVKQGARASGIDLSTMTLTTQGFRPRESGDAADLPGNAREGQRAADTSEPPNYILLAAMGGFGLGAAYLLGQARARKG